MKREDAIKTLKELWRETNDPWYEEVYNMAINALEADRKDEPFDKDINVRSKTEAQTEICNRPQMDCENCWKKLHCRVKDEPQSEKE